MEPKTLTLLTCRSSTCGQTRERGGYLLLRLPAATSWGRKAVERGLAFDLRGKEKRAAESKEKEKFFFFSRRRGDQQKGKKRKK